MARGSPYSMSGGGRGQGRGWEEAWGQEDLYIHVQCTIGNGHMGPPPLITDKHDRKHYLPMVINAKQGDDPIKLTVLSWLGQLTYWYACKQVYC